MPTCVVQFPFAMQGEPLLPGDTVDISDQQVTWYKPDARVAHGIIWQRTALYHEGVEPAVWQHTPLYRDEAEPAVWQRTLLYTDAAEPSTWLRTPLYTDDLED